MAAAIVWIRTKINNKQLHHTFLRARCSSASKQWRICFFFLSHMPAIVYIYSLYQYHLMLVHQTMIDDCMSYYLNIISICHCKRRISIIMFAAHHFRCGRFYGTISIAVAVIFMPTTLKCIRTNKSQISQSHTIDGHPNGEIQLNKITIVSEYTLYMCVIVIRAGNTS